MMGSQPHHRMQNTSVLFSQNKRPLFNPGGLFFPKAKSHSKAAVPAATARTPFVRICVGTGLSASALQQLFSVLSLH
jgi:hypothetical protein